ncbi:hypothetical protein BOTBODRAFT_30613 [Botryobasidium botryosum FD-172 SS1]|uniref:non-specific serine/threonine protein kinase n=1 Tax=Botryobasidium botryosum (strain FD-172 SS1) TaxID=930990 RepID=A0A067MYR7_BOTB1|nr:hypothetical protein BOTBODRAFT_30613 [Botryobasidium botryosum FD-172 SS1]
MSWKFGKKMKDAKDALAGYGSRSTTPVSSRPSTPRGSMDHAPTNSNNAPTFRSGLLTVRVYSGRSLCLPPGVPLPAAIEQVISSGAARNPKNARNNRESMQRRRHWWLPYVVLEFDKNEIMIDALGGEMSAPTWLYKAVFDVSRTSVITVATYLRTQPAVPGENTADMGNDILLARVDLAPTLDVHHMTDQWFPASVGSGEFHLQIQFTPHRQSEPLTIESFDLLKVIGKGSFGKVMQVRKKDTSRIYALKTIRKKMLASRPGEITHILAERTVLALVNNPFIVPLKFSFQSQDKLYLVMSFVNGGELFFHLQREGKFGQDRSRFYAAELLCALEHLHGFNVVYRDLKPENILLDYTGHIALCDFGLCKLNMSQNDKTNTFCGTPEYIAPELLKNEGYTKTVDWWTLGVLLYEMLTGLPPFYDEDVETMYKRILNDPLRFPDDMSYDARSIIAGLLSRDPATRLGANGAEEIKRHPFFAKAIDWNKLWAKQIQPPFKPSVSGLIDVSNFDAEFTSEMPQDSVVDDTELSKTVQERFVGFTYNPVNEHLGGESVGYNSIMH